MYELPILHRDQHAGNYLIFKFGMVVDVMPYGFLLGLELG